MATQQHMNVREVADRVRRDHETTKTVIDRIRSWADYGILRPVGEKHPGTGKKRRFGPETIVDATLLTAITDLGLAAVRVGHFSGEDASVIELCRQAAFTVLGTNEQRDVDQMLVISPPAPDLGRLSAGFLYRAAWPSAEVGPSDPDLLNVLVPSSLAGAIVLNLTQIFKPLRSILEVVRPEPPDFPSFRLKTPLEDNRGKHPKTRLGLEDRAENGLDRGLFRREQDEAPEDVPNQERGGQLDHHCITRAQARHTHAREYQPDCR